MFYGSIPALITPFKDGRVDDQAFQRFVDWQVQSGSHALVPCGTTGESPTLTHAEHKRVVELCIEAAAGRVPVIAGTGSNNTIEAIELTAHAKKAGATAALVVIPYYNKPTQEGLYQHFKALHDAVDIPIIVYNIPGRAVIEMSVETLARLAALPRIIGTKDATNNLERPVKERALIDKDFCLLSGEDGTQVAYLAQGGHGCISVGANVAPAIYAEMHNSWRTGDIKRCFALRDQLAELNSVLFCETNPGPVKYAVSLLGYTAPAPRLPLVEPAAASKEKIKAALVKLGLSV